MHTTQGVHCKPGHCQCLLPLRALSRWIRGSQTVRIQQSASSIAFYGRALSGDPKTTAKFNSHAPFAADAALYSMHALISTDKDLESAAAARLKECEGIDYVRHILLSVYPCCAPVGSWRRLLQDTEQLVQMLLTWERSNYSGAKTRVVMANADARNASGACDLPKWCVSCRSQAVSKCG